MPAKPARRSSEPTMPRQSERDFMAAVVKLAGLLGWRVYHTFDSRRSAPGFPDAVFVKRPRVLFVEFKRDGEHPTPDQQDWLSDLGGCPGVETYLWKPADWPEIERVLSAK